MTATLDGDELVRQWRDWHAKREEELRAPHGWLSLTGLHWLTPAPTVIEGVPGHWSADASGVTLAASADDGLTIDDRPVSGSERIEPVDGLPGVLVRHGELAIEVIRRTDWFALRIRDPKARTRTEFTGVPAYPVSPDWVFEARFEPWPEQRRVTVGAVVDGLTHKLPAAGTLHFTHDGTDHELIAFAKPDGTLNVLFTDATSGVTTYPACRGLTVPTPTDEGVTVLDFNRATNLPCAFTTHATCPIAPPENRLPFAIEAGETNPKTQRPHP
ncbi:DUF1684 domain-containing protein [Pseudonocardia acaciae]|uniref:DUF1684 domain-containing protein n=1 Tax=Pseudonocardia acaciae TaxID=551276 RepID=UPI00048A986F|nr:DUF1684 domain-containing protein [Pseudonocardia acaciae]